MTAHRLASALKTLWFGSFFTLSSGLLKLQVAVLAVSPMLLWSICLFWLQPVRKYFFNAHKTDSFFGASLIAFVMFILMMLFNTIESDWMTRATAELVKTTLFFLLAHVFCSIFLSTENLPQKIWISLGVSACFVFSHL